jgi:hypothetical protein
VADDPRRQWQQWQAFAALFVPANAASPDLNRRASPAGMAPLIDAADRFRIAAQAFMDSASSGSAPVIAQAAQRFGEFLREQFEATPLPWSAALDTGGAQGPAAGLAYGTPAVGATREHQQRWERMADAWRRIGDAQRRLQRLWSDALREAALAFAARLQRSVSAPSPAGLPELYDAWIDCAEDAYARMAHSDAFCNAQAEFVNAGSAWRTEMQTSLEQWAKLLDLPTRSEINTLGRRLKAVEEQLRSSQPAAQMEAAPAAATALSAAQAKAAPGAKAARKPRGPRSARRPAPRTARP